ncbi:hypothetical protein [Noviherbaspirillum sp. ST9]
MAKPLRFRWMKNRDSGYKNPVKCRVEVEELITKAGGLGMVND